MERQQYYNVFSGASFDGPNQTIEADVLGYNSIHLYNTSAAGNIIIFGSFFIGPQQGIILRGNEQELNKGKFTFTLFNFASPAPYSYCLIRKQYF